MIFRVTWRVLFLLVASTFFLPDWTLAEEPSPTEIFTSEN